MVWVTCIIIVNLEIHALGVTHLFLECSKNSNGEECFIFASKRTIKWKNGINPGKGKASKISRKWTKDEIKNKLSELGFY